MPLAIFLTLYGVVALYAGIAYLAGPLVPLATIVALGLPVVVYLMLEWVATPLVAVAVGFHARWSLLTAVALGVPLVVLFTFVTPVVGSGDPNLSVPVPWLSVYSASKESALATARERLVWWASVYLACITVGLVSRRIRPISHNAA